MPLLRHVESDLPRSHNLWSGVTIAERHFQILNLDHPRIAARVLDDIDAGIAVYYDRRWTVTQRFCDFLMAAPAWVR